MAAEERKVNGLILRETSVGDYDKILNILTENGRITVSGKGIKSLKNANMPATQLFCYSAFVLRKRGGYYYIVESELIENFFRLRGDIDQLALAAYLCDVTYDVTMEENDEQQMLRLTLNTLYALAKNKHSLSLIKAAFELKTAQIIGFMPDLSTCAKCLENDENMLENQVKQYYLDVMNGHLLCEKCVSEIRQKYYERDKDWHTHNFSSPNSPDIDENGTRLIFLPVTETLLSAMRYIIGARLEKYLSFAIDTREIKDFSKMCESYLLHHLEHGFHSLDFYKSIVCS